MLVRAVALATALALALAEPAAVVTTTARQQLSKRAVLRPRQSRPTRA